MRVNHLSCHTCDCDTLVWQQWNSRVIPAPKAEVVKLFLHTHEYQARGQKRTPQNTHDALLLHQRVGDSWETVILIKKRVERFS